MIEIKRASARFPVIAAVAAPRLALIAPYARIASYAKIGSGVLGVLLLGFVAVTLRRRPTLMPPAGAPRGPNAGSGDRLQSTMQPERRTHLALEAD